MHLGLALYINAKAGESYKYHVETVQTVDVKQNGQKITTNQNIALTLLQPLMKWIRKAILQWSINMMP